MLRSPRCLAGLLILSSCAIHALAAPQPVRAQTNLAAASAGGRLLFFSSQYDDSTWAAANLIDGSPNSGWSGQSNGAQAVVLAFRDGALAELEDVVVNPYSRESEANWVRQVEIHVSTTYPFRDFRPAGTLTLTPEGTDQVFSFDRPTPVRYLKLVFLANGGGGYMQAGEIRAMGRLTGGGPAPAYRSLHEGATIESFTSEYDDSGWAAANLLAPDTVRGQWAGRSNGVQEVVVALPEAATVTDVAVSNYAREADVNWAREAEVLLSPTSPYKGFVSAGRLDMAPRGELHTLTLDQPTPARYVKVIFRRNGGGGYMEAARIRIFHAAAADTAPAPAAAAQTIAAQLEATGRAVTQEIHFAFNSAEILSESEPVLAEIAAVLQDQPALELIIEGHTDGVGSADSNLELSRRRAEAVKRWLVDRLGVAELRLTTVGYGLTKPIADNSTDDGRARNRRVELVRKG